MDPAQAHGVGLFLVVAIGGREGAKGRLVMLDLPKGVKHGFGQPKANLFPIG